jgi:hypothetical protein
MLITGLLSSCFKEDLSDCPLPFQVTIKALDIDLNDITESGEVKNAILFAFDENQNLVGAFELTEDQVKSRKSIDIVIDYPGFTALTFIAWGNVDGNLDYSQISSVKKLVDLYVRLSVKDGFAQPASDFFRGNLIVPVEYGESGRGQSHVVEIKRMTSGVTITAINLKEWNENKDGNYTYVVRSSMNTYNPDGQLAGEHVNYSPRASFYQNGDFSAPIFYTFPTEHFIVDIYYNGELIYTADKNSNGNPLVPEVGRTLNIIIDFRAEISIKSVITPWNVVYQYVEY